MIYRKQGAVARWENGTLVRVRESGVAIEEGELFTCRPEGTTTLDVVPSRVLETARIISDLRGVERLIVTEGIALHEEDGRTWTERTERVHLSLVRGTTRALIDLASFDLHDILRTADAMNRLQDERDAPPRLRFAANVTAALLPSLIGVAPPNVELTWTIESYRPSYRIRPVQMPMNFLLRCAVTDIERDRPVAVAILAPPEGLVMRVLVDDGEAAFPATVRITRIDAVGEETIWYPYGGGSFGAEMML